MIGKIFIVALLIGTCNKVVNKPALNISTKDIAVVSNDSYATWLLQKGININPKGKFILDIKEKGSNGFSFIQRQDTFFITGNSWKGVVCFLDHYCGVRFYMPTALWISKPKDSITIDSGFTYSHKPFTPVVLATGFKGGDEYVWYKYEQNIANTSYGVTQHSMSGYFYDSSCLKLFPSVYKNGFPKSPTDQNFEPDFTDSNCVAASMYLARKFFKANWSLTMSFSVMDSYNGYPTPIPNKTLTQSYTEYLNALADSFKIVFPGRTITYIIYGKVNQFPPPVKLRDNVVLICVDHISDGIGATDRYKGVSAMGNHDWAEGYGYIVPRIYSHLLQDYLDTIIKAKVDFKFAHLEMYPNWSLDGMKYYEMVKLYDNPSLNIDSIRTEFCTDMFGTAAVQMKNYFDDLEALSTSMNNNPLINRHLGDYKTQMELTVQDSILAYHARLSIDSALTKVSGTELQRVQFFSNGFKISEGLWKIYNGDTSFISGYEQFLKDSINRNQMYLNIATTPTFLSDINTFINKLK